jgi:hypothetical protein
MLYTTGCKEGNLSLITINKNTNQISVILEMRMYQQKSMDSNYVFYGPRGDLPGPFPLNAAMQTIYMYKPNVTYYAA